uniref:Bifunctional DNA-formamidopyrimidine glycosylase/DNA-(Apurinic or apyrimidinic site) lyase n=1 Tax=candidate division WOR-3 bacterium TaxID=2052148 RepID=A0A7C4XJ92_UNCW3
MPELPEIETIKRELKPQIVNQEIIGCKIFRKDIVGYPNAKLLCSSIIGERILDVGRRAKYLILYLSSEKRLIFHLRLSGAIIFKRKFYKNKDLGRKFIRLVILLNKGIIIFEEPRALGRVYLLKGDERPVSLSGFFNLGYEPICPEYNFSYFKEKIGKRRAMIKALLLDQSICAGVGNIYSDEALFRAGIKPTRRAYTLTTEELFKLLCSLKEVLREGIDNFGTTVSDYKRTNGKSGNFQNFLYVYARENQPCRICGTKIILKKIGNRGTRYCPLCQQ